jgi:hypothetical protein
MDQRMFLPGAVALLSVPMSSRALPPLPRSSLESAVYRWDRLRSVSQGEGAEAQCVSGGSDEDVSPVLRSLFGDGQTPGHVRLSARMLHEQQVVALGYLDPEGQRGPGGGLVRLGGHSC